MDIFFCRATPMNYTLIPYTDQYIFEALSHLFPDTNAHFFGENFNQGDNDYLMKMHQAVLSDRPMMSFDATGKIPLHRSPVPVEQFKFNHFSDAPYGFMNYISTMKSGATASYSDRSFLEFYKDAKLDVQPVFMPHGGPLNVDIGKNLKDRKYPISFIGNLRNPEPIGAFETVFAGSDDAFISIVRKASEMNLNEGVEAYLAFKASCIEAGYDPMELLPMPSLCQLLSKMGAWSEMQRRLQLLRALKDFPIHIFGPVVGEIKGVTDQNHHFHGPKKGDEVIDIIKETRVILNSVTQFPDGSHERIWFAMAHGCMIYTDYSRYVAETFTNQENILFIDYYNLDQDIQKLISYVTEADRLQPLMDRAVSIYQKNHTWLNRIDSAFRQMPEMEPYMSRLK